MPAPASITAPSVGDPTRKEAFAQAVIDWITYFNSLVNSSADIVPNGSFEYDSDADGEPDSWVIDEMTGGTFLLDESTTASDDKAVHGKRSAKFTSIGGGAPNGGGTLTSAEFIPCSEDKVYLVQWQTKSSVIGVRNLVEIQWFDSTQVSISTTTIFDEATANPTSWTLMHALGIAPNNARYFKLIITCADDSDATAGSVWIDDVRLSRIDFQLRAEYKTAGEYYWKAPTSIRLAMIICMGGGGGGGDSGASNANAGGGSGGMAQGIISVYPGTLVTVTVGAGGAGGSGGAGSNGADSTFGALTGGGGTGGATLGGAGGAGGTASGGQLNTTGIAGSARVSTTVGGDGGESLWSGDYGPGGASGNAGKAATMNGGGGGGAGDGAGTGGDGAAGMVLIYY